jgi:hypothetical protein
VEHGDMVRLLVNGPSSTVIAASIRVDVITV